MKLSVLYGSVGASPVLPPNVAVAANSAEPIVLLRQSAHRDIVQRR